MALIDPVKALCKKLAASPRWLDLLKAHGLDLSVIDLNNSVKLADALSQPLTIKREVAGFGDFANDGKRAIEPGNPSRSLLFHALASPNVLSDSHAVPLDLFPTPAELDAVENYIFGVQKAKLADVLARFPGKTFAVVVFACEYRPARDTVHRQHADMVYARTGNARVGTKPARYVPEFRGFHPEVPGEPHSIAVTPARYTAYLAVQLKGNNPQTHIMGTAPDDSARNFWIPVHKLFPGKECLDGLNLTVDFTASHVNEKIFRAQKALGKSPPDEFPYRVRDNNLAELSTKADMGPGWIFPKAQPLVQEAIDKTGNDVTFDVPSGSGAFATVDMWAIKGNQAAPEYLHARTLVPSPGARVNLNESNTPPVDQKVKAGGYMALHYVDFTGDGFVDAKCSQIQGVSGIAAQSSPAYSVLAAPDFYPTAGQRELMEWVASIDLPRSIKSKIWGSNRPESLNSQRLAANVQMPGSPFKINDESMTAIVGLSFAASSSPTRDAKLVRRQSYLTDDGAGVFAPGWEVSQDVFGGKMHLAAYGLGSPFPEDSKLCAALSSFWPAVAPDVTRTMDTATASVPGANLSGTVIPMTDAEIGQVGTLPWDGVAGPTTVQELGKTFAEYNSFIHADYVRNALAGKFSLTLTSKVDFNAYSTRILGMIYGYLALGVERSSGLSNPALNALNVERKKWIVFSFQEIVAGATELTQAIADTSQSPLGPYYRVSVFRADDPTKQFFPSPTNFQKRRIEITGRLELILAPTDKVVFLKKPSETKWRNGVVKLG